MWIPITGDVRLYVRLVDDCLEFIATESGKRLSPVKRMDRTQFLAFCRFQPAASDDWLLSIEEASKDAYREENRNHIRVMVDGKSVGRREFADFYNLVREELGADPLVWPSTESWYEAQEEAP